MNDAIHVAVEEGTIRDIPPADLVIEERVPVPQAKPAPALLKGLIVVPMEGVSSPWDSG